MFHTRLPLFASLVSAILVSTLLPAFSAPISGTSCSKLQSTKTVGNIKYTCVKSGKGLVWNKGILIQVKATPTPTPSSTRSSEPLPSASPSSSQRVFKPWDTDVTAKELSDAAQAEFIKWVSNYSFGEVKHKLITQAGTPPERLRRFSEADQLASKLFSKYIGTGSVTVIGTDENWVVKNLNSNGGKFTSCNSNAGDVGLNYCLEDFDGKQGFVVTTDGVYNPKDPARDNSSLLVHEYFHSVQTGMINYQRNYFPKIANPGFSKDFPVWLIEGSANFIGFSMIAYLNNEKYWDGYSAMLGYAPQRPDINRNALSDYEVRTCCGNDKPTYPYIIGQIATQYLVASIGVKNFLDLWLKAEETEKFDETFKKVVGMTKEAFYAKFEAIRSNINFPPVTWKLVCVNNQIINKEISSLSSLEKSQVFDANTCLYGPTTGPSNSSEPSNQPNQENLLEKPCTNVGEERTTFYLWVCVNEKNKGKIWIKKGTESQYQLSG